jgi:hypothetical protein
MTLTSSTIDATAIEHAAGKILMKLQRSNIKNTHWHSGSGHISRNN